MQRLTPYQGGTHQPPPQGGNRGTLVMMIASPLSVFSNLIERARAQLAKRREYKRLVTEIEGFSTRDLADIRADRSEMLRSAYRKVYG
jgi:hypothetical protein